MKVNGQQPSLSQEVKANSTRAKGDGTPEGGTLQGANSAEQPSVKTTLVLDKLKDRIHSEPEVRSERVAALKSQISQGSYKVDTQRLAGNLIKDALHQES